MAALISVGIGFLGKRSNYVRNYYLLLRCFISETARTTRTYLASGRPLG